MFEWFESRLNPYPTEKTGTPPNGILAFCWHYSGSAWPWLVMMSLLTASISISEVYLFGVLGNIILLSGFGTPSQISVSSLIPINQKEHFCSIAWAPHDPASPPQVITCHDVIARLQVIPCHDVIAPHQVITFHDAIAPHQVATCHEVIAPANFF